MVLVHHLEIVLVSVRSTAYAAILFEIVFAYSQDSRLSRSINYYTNSLATSCIANEEALPKRKPESKPSNFYYRRLLVHASDVWS